MDKVKNINKFQKMVIYFFIYAFLGWICEEIFCFFINHEIVNRGFLFGPVCPIYGYGALIIILCFNDYKKKNIKLFFLSAIVFSVFEYITDFFLQALFATRFWDYSGYFLNLNSRIALSFSIMWGIGGLIFINILHPFITKKLGKILSKISTNIQRIIIDTLIIIIVLDTIISSIIYLGII